MLPEGEVHLHLVRPDEIDEPGLLDRYGELLSSEERERCARFRHPRLRHAALITRALVRLTLSRYATISPESWRFRAGAHGRPEVLGDARGLSFNVAHTEGLIVCGVVRTRDRDVVPARSLGALPARALGVDVEHVNLRADPLALAEQFFAVQEIAALRSLTGDALHERFLAIWTLKEAYAKARGLGLNLPLDRYAFTLEDDDRVKLWVDESVREDDGPWQFERRAIGPHRLAIALRRMPSEPPLAIHTFEGLSEPDSP